MLAIVLMGVACGTMTAAVAGEASRTQTRSLEEIVVTAKRDEAIRLQVERALHDNPYFYDGHVTVTIKNGVVTLSGLVFDDWDLRTAKRIAKRVPGVRRVIDDIEIKLGGE